MIPRVSTAVFLFHRDLRLVDNTALNAAFSQAKTVLPVMIFDPRQCEKHDFFSSNALQFFLESLEEVVSEIEQQGGTLFCFHGDPEKILTDLFSTQNIDAIFFNEDVTPFARARDRKIETLAAKKNVASHRFSDTLLHHPESIRTKEGKPFQVFTPYFHAAEKEPIRPLETKTGKWWSGPLAGAQPFSALSKKLLSTQNPDLFVRGGRKKALEIFGKISNFSRYEAERDFPAADATTHLSAHLKFGTVSPREVYHRIVSEFSPHHPLLRQLFWRDFFSQVAFHFPQVFGQAFREPFRSLKWDNDPDKFEAWKKGQTGFPLVDAGMRQLVRTGWMHNRVRMVAASFLVKNLGVDWRWGEQFFAQHLVDYDPAVNNGNWQWVASTGCDAQPYFRIFNPWRQQEKFDPEAEFIKTWLPELRSLSAKEIHHWSREAETLSSKLKYPRPIVDPQDSAGRAKQRFLRARQSA
ncbi:MAG: DNA photolyase family protein [Candidatus Gracilibacteria bacterium]|nr:DNA photolyase family protein [Candidatus Gracilibacteria bacterium]